MVRDGNALFVIAGDTTGAGMTSYAADPELGNALEPLCAAAIVCL
jgi:hypothetical protein